MRHGESAANIGHPTTDHASIPLTEKGILQAKRFADHVEQEPDLIISSPFTRALDTAHYLIEKNPGISFIELDYIHEMNNFCPAKCVGTTAKERAPMVEDYWKNCNPKYIDGPGAESFEQFIGRVSKFVEYLGSVGQKKVYAFGHGRFFQALIFGVLCNDFRPTKEYMERFMYFFLLFPISNTASVPLTLFNNHWHVGSIRENK